MTSNDTSRRTRTIQTLERVYEYDMSSVVNRFRKDYGVGARKSKEYEIELKRYLTLCAFSDLNYGMAGRLDYLWHTFIIHTKDYMLFCQEYFGHFIHHSPLDNSEKNNDASGVYLAYFAHYQDVIGNLPPRHIWTYPSKNLLQKPHLAEYRPLFANVKHSRWDLERANPKPSGVICGNPTCEFGKCIGKCKRN